MKLELLSRAIPLFNRRAEGVGKHLRDEIELLFNVLLSASGESNQLIFRRISLTSQNEQFNQPA